MSIHFEDQKFNISEDANFYCKIKLIRIQLNMSIASGRLTILPKGMPGLFFSYIIRYNAYTSGKLHGCLLGIRPYAFVGTFVESLRTLPTARELYNNQIKNIVIQKKI